MECVFTFRGIQLGYAGGVVETSGGLVNAIPGQPHRYRTAGLPPGPSANEDCLHNETSPLHY